MVNYSDLDALKVTDHPGPPSSCTTAAGQTPPRYFMVAANQSNKIAAVDLKDGKLAGR